MPRLKRRRPWYYDGGTRLVVSDERSPSNTSRTLDLSGPDVITGPTRSGAADEFHTRAPIFPVITVARPVHALSRRRRLAYGAWAPSKQHHHTRSYTPVSHHATRTPDRGRFRVTFRRAWTNASASGSKPDHGRYHSISSLRFSYFSEVSFKYIIPVAGRINIYVVIKSIIISNTQWMTAIESIESHLENVTEVV